MSLYINEVEAVWLSVNTVTLVLTLFAVHDAWIQQGVVKRLNGRAREIAAAGNVRREIIRLGVQALFLSVVVPGLFVDAPAIWSPPVIALVLVPVLLLIASSLDTIDRRRLLGTVAAELVTKNEKSLSRIEVAISQNTDLTQLAADHADAAYQEANSVNEKIATQGAVIVKQGEDALTDRERGGRIEATGKDTNARTIDIQDRLP